jgi:hypothetical protein
MESEVRLSKGLRNCATLAWTFRAGAVASLAGVVWAIHKMNVTPEGGGLPYFLFWTPLFLGIALVLTVTSFLVGGPESRVGKEATPSRGLNLWMHALIGAGVIALLGEAVVIFGEGKRIQAVELLMLSAVVVGIRIWIHRLPPRPQRRVNLWTIPALIALGLGWWPVLMLVLSVFDR